MLDKVDEMIIGGGMAFTFRKELDNMPVRCHPLLRSVTTTLSLCVYFGTHFFVISCHFLHWPKVGRVNFWKGTREMTIFHLLYILESMPLLQIVATLVTPFPVDEVVFLLYQTMNGEGRTVAWHYIGRCQNLLVLVFVLKKMENTTFIASLFLGSRMFVLIYFLKEISSNFFKIVLLLNTVMSNI